MSIDIESAIPDGDLTLVLGVRSHRDDEKLKNCAQSVPKNIENYRKISKFIEIWEALKKGFLQGKSFIFCAFSFSRLTYTR
jgi:hypothetical protein